MIAKTERYIAKNSERLVEISAIYDAKRGVGSPIPRFKLTTRGKGYLLLPESMMQEELVKLIVERGSLYGYSLKSKKSYKELSAHLSALRLKYDFEYWCATCVKVQDKNSKRMVPFILRRPQRRLFALIYGQMQQKVPIRVVLLKARQWGGSTLIQIFMAWIQLFHRQSWHSAIVTDVEDQARNIRAMYSRVGDYYPDVLPKIEFKNFEGSTKNKIIPSRKSIIYMASMQRPDSLRSADIMMAHLSEVGLWRDTQGKSPEDVVQTVAGSVPMEELSMIVVESTAKGVGNYFHRLYQGAERGDNGFAPLFIPWYGIETYMLPFPSDDSLREFITSMSDTEQQYFELGATLEGIHWYRTKMRSEGYDTWRMGCEFPTTTAEAFQSTGRRAHSPIYTALMRKGCIPAKYVGELTADAMQGKEAIGKSLSFTAQAGGTFWVWEMPESEPEMRNRYIVSMDIGGRTDSADYSVISVIDRADLIDGGVERCIATARFHLDQDLAIWRAVQVAAFYNKALLVVEANSLNSKSSEGDHSLTILDEIKDLYPNLYARGDVRSINERRPVRYGFFTSSASKTDLVTQMNKRMREQSYIEYDARAIDEADIYEIKSNGTYGAVEGEHDDIYMSRAIGLKASQIYDPPALVQIARVHKPRRKVSSESTF